jgi:chromosome segregation ATPase
MVEFRTRVVPLLSAFVVLGFASIAPRVIAQVPGSLPSPTVQQPDLMPALLAEVKAIRAEVGEVARASTRSQLLLGRVQLQQLHLGRLDQQLAAASARVIEAARDRATIATQLRDLERRRQEEMSADERTAVEADHRRLRAQLKELQSIEEQHRREETELSAALSAEEERLRELASRLDALEARLSR